MRSKNPARFRQLALDLEAAARPLDSSWQPPEPLLRKEEDAWLRQEAECRAELDKIVTGWVLDRILPDMPDQQKYFVRLRFVAAHRFLYQFTLNDRTTVFPFPNLSEEDFLVWMLTTWWHSVGCQEALFYIDSTFSERRAST